MINMIGAKIRFQYSREGGTERTSGWGAVIFPSFLASFPLYLVSDVMIYLASASPRRQELLQQVGLAFAALPSNILEEQGAGESPVEYVRRVAADKARHVARLVAGRGLPVHPVLAEG